MKAVGEYIVIEMINEQLKVNNLILSDHDKSKQRYIKGKIISVGSLCTEALEKDDVVYYDSAGAFQLLVNENAITVIRQRDIVAVV